MAQFILHLADVHIGAGDSTEYRAVFNNLFNAIVTFPRREQLVVVICGDVFHHYSSAALADFGYFINGLTDTGCQVIIIPGEHDADLIESALSMRALPNVHYWKQSGQYSVAGLRFLHVSVLDAAGPAEIAARVKSLDRPNEVILLYHGAIDGATNAGHTLFYTRIGRDVIDAMRLTLAGGIHRTQFITPRAAYPGSLIQQNAAESYVKGFIFWDLSRDVVGNFVRVANPYGYVRLDLRGVVDAAPMIDRIKASAPSRPYRVHLLIDGHNAELEQRVKAAFGRLDQVSRGQVHFGAGKSDAVLTAALMNRGATAEQAATFVQMYTAAARAGQRSWTLLSLTFDNFFRYGAGNHIDFTKIVGGIGGVVAENRAGKSSILDIVVFGLWGILLRGNKQTMIRHGARSAYVRVEFELIGAERYAVERHDDRGKHAKLSLWRRDGDAWVNVPTKSAEETYRQVHQLIGPVDHFLATSMYYDAHNDITRMAKSDRMKILSELFGLADTAVVSKDIKSRLRAIKMKIDALVKPRDGAAESVPRLEAELAELMRRTAAVNAELERAAAPTARSLDVVKAELSRLGTKHRPIDAIEADLAPLGQLSAIDGRISQIKYKPSQADSIARLKARLDKIRAGTSLEFNDVCRRCQANKIILAKDMAETEEELMRLTAAEEAVVKYNAEAAALEKQLRAERSNIARLDAELAAARRYASLVTELKAAEAASRRSALLSELATLQRSIGATQAALDVAAKERAIAEEYNRDYPALKAEYDLLKLYGDCVTSASFRADIIRGVIGVVIERANDLLTQIGDFRLGHHVDESVELHIIEAGDATIPIDMASGYQRFVVSMAFRLALSSVVAGPAFMFIDEGFGSSDKPNLTKIGDLLITIAPQYRFVFIVTHLDDIRRVIDRPMFIMQRDGSSFVNNSIDVASAASALNEIGERNDKLRPAVVRLDPARVGHRRAEPAQPEPGKVCDTCGEHKPFKQYGRNGRAADGLKSMCRDCFRSKRDLKK